MNDIPTRALPPPRREPPRPLVTRRVLLLGAGAALTLGLGGAAVSVGSDLPGQRGALRSGTVDQSSAQWTAASDANYRYANRPEDYTIDRIVIHVTQSRFASAARAFQDPGHRAAAHYLVRASDGHIAQLVREADVAYHAGNREWNERSIGIEHEGFVDAPNRWFTDAAYRASAELAADISARYDIPVDREHIVGHDEVPGATHTDPGPSWDWDRYLSLVRAVR
ncbi:N-acetylmuramoyl-L-alanine amidase [Streptomyces himalayensis]|uniref:N-acetylmuramoyl-L-alanine amidase n=1 Tax=Streptomyces himalayensis subsp. himalayensis TaxID=2756131 RepID=A0A7W0DVF1_9ACTN|nr:N-acetylmuramoyl-L-alanine amidase [Streptomyces himalayensis]MBA2951940.1 N-acetylmuramoyl-L-alanine amidase [Streptomyces himalayensis subsp. himalayensis]